VTGTTTDVGQIDSSSSSSSHHHRHQRGDSHLRRHASEVSVLSARD
jgi:hypothetical protein